MKTQPSLLVNGEVLAKSITANLMAKLTGTQSASPAAVADRDAEFATEFEANKVQLQRADIALEEYVASRRVTELHNGQFSRRAQPELLISPNAGPFEVGSPLFMAGQI